MARNEAKIRAMGEFVAKSESSAAREYLLKLALAKRRNHIGTELQNYGAMITYLARKGFKPPSPTQDELDYCACWGEQTADLIKSEPSDLLRDAKLIEHLLDPKHYSACGDGPVAG